MTTTQRDAISSPATGLEIYNTTTNKFNYYNGSSWTAVGSGLSTAILSTGSTLSVGTEYHANTATAAFTATLPSAPVDGSHIRIVDVKGTFDTNNLTVSRGGSDTIEGSTSVLLSSENGVFDFHYDSGETRWSLAEHDTPAPVTLHQVRMTRSTAQSIPSDAFTKVTLNAEDFDTGGIGNTSTGTITITQAGRYQISGELCFTTAAVFNAQLEVRVGGSRIGREIMRESSGNGFWCPGVTVVRDLSTSDTVELYVFHQAGTSVNTSTNVGDQPFLEVIQLPTSVIAGAGISDLQDADGDTRVQLEESADEDKIRFDTAGTERMIISGDGNVGIGTSSPASTLHIKPSTAAALQIDPFGASAGNAGEVRFLELLANGANYVGFQAPDLITGDVVWTLPNADGTNGQALVTDGSGALAWANAGGGTELKDADSDTKVQVEESADEDKIRFDTAGTERMIISGDGNVGIGTSTPSASSILELSSTSKGMLLPRMTTTQRDAISSPATGLGIYNTTDNKFNYYNGTNWTAVGVGTNRFIHAELSADQTSVTTGTDIVFNTKIVGNGITLNTGSGVFTLTAGATYELDAALFGVTYSGVNGALVYEWVNSSNVSLGGTAAGVYRVDATSNISNQPLAKLIITPSSDQEVKLRVTAANGTGSVFAARSYASITQINSSGSDLITTSYIHAGLDRGPDQRGT